MKIAHASISENGTVNGRKGDQTKREVCIRDWWDFNYSVVLRCKDENIRNRMVSIAQDGCYNDNIGYSQFQNGGRNSLHSELVKNGYNFKKVGPCNTDCSAYITAVAIAAGVKSLEYTGNAPTTSTMVNAFANTGLFEVHKEADVLHSSRNLAYGDILVAPGNHTVICIEWGKSFLDFFAYLASRNASAKANVFYQVKAGGHHYGEVVNTQDYAGVEGRPFEKLAIRVDKGTVAYQVHILGRPKSEWLPYVTGYNWWDNENGYAGLTNGGQIDGIRIKTSGTGGKARYKVSTIGSTGYLPSVVEDSDFAGIYGKAIDKLQIEII